MFGLGAEAGRLLTQGEWNDAVAVLSGISERAGGLIGTDEAAAIVGEDQGWFSGIVGGAVDTARDYASAAGYFLNEADALFGAVLTIVAIFLLRLLVLPLVLLLIAVQLVRLVMPRLAEA